MQPIKVSDEMLNDLVGAHVVTYAAPEEAKDDVNDVQGLFELGVPGRFGPDRIYIPWQPDADELKALNAGHPVWLAVLSHRMPVVQVYVQPLPGEGGVRLLDGPHDGKFIPRAECRDEVGLRPAIDFDDGSIYQLYGDSYRWVDMTDTIGPIELNGTDFEPAGS